MPLWKRLIIVGNSAYVYFFLVLGLGRMASRRMNHSEQSEKKQMNLLDELRRLSETEIKNYGNPMLSVRMPDEQIVRMTALRAHLELTTDKRIPVDVYQKILDACEIEGEHIGWIDEERYYGFTRTASSAREELHKQNAPLTAS